MRQTKLDAKAAASQFDLFADFNGIPEGVDKTEFYRHDQNWSNRMILGDSLQVMASLAEREGLRGCVQCIYFDPPYGIKFNSNFQWSTTSRDVKDGNTVHITREPEQVKAFRDTWRDGIHSYLTYLRDRLTVARDLLTESGSIFVQIGDENVHRVRAVMDEVFGEDNHIATIGFLKTSSATSSYIPSTFDSVIWFGKNKSAAKFRQLLREKSHSTQGADEYAYFSDETNAIFRLSKTDLLDRDKASHSLRIDNLTSQSGGDSTRFQYDYQGRTFFPGSGGWKTSLQGMVRLDKAGRLHIRSTSMNYVRFLADFPALPLSNTWEDTAIAGWSEGKVYVVQTARRVIERCLLLTTDPGDLVLDPTCGSGTTAYVAEQWGRRWITIDTSRVALALARARIMGARYPFYLLADSREGREKEWQVGSGQWSVKPPEPLAPCHNNIRHGFVYERVPHITLKSIANNAEIDVIWEQHEQKLAPLRDQLSVASGQKKTLEEWDIPRERPDNWPLSTNHLLHQWWQARIARQKEIDASIAAKAECEYLYDKPYEDRKKVRVAGPFTVESLSPHRVLGVDENDELIDRVSDTGAGYGEKQTFPQMILENLKTAGVQQAHKEDKITFTALTPWPGDLVCAEGRFSNVQWPVVSDQKQTTSHKPQGAECRAAIFIGPEFGTVTRPDLVAAAREAGDADFDVLIACAFNYEAHATEFTKLGRIPVLKTRMNADLHMADDLKNTGKGNLFVIFGEPDITVASEEWLVDSSGRRIAPYEIFKLVSGVNSLAEINRLGRDDLRDYAQLSIRREVWDYITNAAGGNFDSGKHRRGTSLADHRGVSSVARHCAGLAGGTGNLSDFIRTIGTSQQSDIRHLAQGLRRDQQNAQRAHEIPIHSPLTTLHYSQVTIHGVDVFHPQTGEVRSDSADGIACWFIDTDYNEESFFVRHAYFLGANDPYSALKTTLKAEINEEAWATLNSDTSRSFPKPKSGRIAVKVINHLGDEVMKVFKV